MASMKRSMSRGRPWFGAEDSSVRPVAVGVGRSAPSQPPPFGDVPALFRTGPEPEAEGDPPPAVLTSAGGVTRNAQASIRDHRSRRRPMKESKKRTPPFTLPSARMGTRSCHGSGSSAVRHVAGSSTPTAFCIALRPSNSRATHARAIASFHFKPPAPAVDLPRKGGRCGSPRASDTAAAARWP